MLQEQAARKKFEPASKFCEGAPPSSTIRRREPPMRRLPLLLAAALLTGAAPAYALTHEDATQMTCAEAAALVRAQGQVVLDTGPTTFDLFVRDQSFCPIDKIASPARAPTRDQPECPVGYRCESPIPTVPLQSP